MTHVPRLCVPTLCIWLLPGCSWMPWLGMTKEPVHFGVVSVQLNTSPPKGKQITYAVAGVHKGKKLKEAGFQRLSKEGAASFVLPMDQLYDVRIFCDLNHNQSLDANEPNGLVENVTPTRPTAADPRPVTLAFGVLGPVAGSTRVPHAAAETPPASPPELPPEAKPYLKYVPQWLQDKLLR